MLRVRVGFTVADAQQRVSSASLPLNLFTASGQRFRSNRVGLSCLRYANLPRQPPRPAAFAPFVKGDLCPVTALADS